MTKKTEKIIELTQLPDGKVGFTNDRGMDLVFHEPRAIDMLRVYDQSEGKGFSEVGSLLVLYHLCDNAMSYDQFVNEAIVSFSDLDKGKAVLEHYKTFLSSFSS